MNLSNTDCMKWWQCPLEGRFKKTEILKKIKSRTSYDPVITFVGIYLKKTKTRTQKILNPYVHCSNVYNNRDTETAQVPRNTLKWKKWGCSVVSNSLRPLGLYSLPGSSVHGIFQAGILEWVAISFSRRSSQPRDWTWVSHIAGRRFTIWATSD